MKWCCDPVVDTGRELLLRRSAAAAAESATEKTKDGELVQQPPMVREFWRGATYLHSLSRTTSGEK
jgi:hypothetical protein